MLMYKCFYILSICIRTFTKNVFLHDFNFSVCLILTSFCGIFFPSVFLFLFLNYFGDQSCKAGLWLKKLKFALIESHTFEIKNTLSYLSLIRFLSFSGLYQIMVWRTLWFHKVRWQRFGIITIVTMKQKKKSIIRL